MSEPVTVEKIADEMYQLVAECHGKKNLKAGDLTKAMQAKFGESCSKDDCKKAIRILIDSARCTYSYVGGSYIVLPPKEGEAAQG
jgi:intergrase/recombinase